MYFECIPFYFKPLTFNFWCVYYGGFSLKAIYATSWLEWITNRHPSARFHLHRQSTSAWAAEANWKSGWRVPPRWRRRQLVEVPRRCRYTSAARRTMCEPGPGSGSDVRPRTCRRRTADRQSSNTAAPRKRLQKFANNCGCICWQQINHKHFTNNAQYKTVAYEQ